MPNNSLDIIFIGDVVGKYGRRFLNLCLPLIKKKYKPDLVIANGENSAGGLGITRKTANEVFAAGVDIITGGNHIWDKKDALELLNENKRILRPLNYPTKTPGNGSAVFKTSNGCEVLIINLQGRVFMEPVVDNPFLIIEDFLKSVKNKCIIIDFHAEATAEKQAMGFFLNGKVSALLCTHTHVPTADLRILSNGTAYQSDVGMTGSLDSVIGMKRQPIIDRFKTGINHRFEVAKNNLILDMSIIRLDQETGKAVGAEFHRIYENKFEDQLK